MAVVVSAFSHSLAAHLLDRGEYIHKIQELLGNSDVRTTIIFTHVLNRGSIGLCSPAALL